MFGVIILFCKVWLACACHETIYAEAKNRQQDFLNLTLLLVADRDVDPRIGILGSWDYTSPDIGISGILKSRLGKNNKLCS